MIALLTPSAVKLAHLFENHEHVVCETPLSSHFHELDWECEFYKFKLNNQFNFSLKSIDFVIAQITPEIPASSYEFNSKFKRSQIALRAPPALV